MWRLTVSCGTIVNFCSLTNNTYALTCVIKYSSINKFLCTPKPQAKANHLVTRVVKTCKGTDHYSSAGRGGSGDIFPYAVSLQGIQKLKSGFRSCN